jgi:hypothetical protein
MNGSTLMKLQLQQCTATCGTTDRNPSSRRTGRHIVELAIAIALAVMVVYAEVWAFEQAPTIAGAGGFVASTDTPAAGTRPGANTVLCSLPIAVLH